MTRRPMASGSVPNLGAIPFGIWIVTGIDSAGFGLAFATRIVRATLQRAGFACKLGCWLAGKGPDQRMKRTTKPETRNPKSEGNPRPEIRNPKSGGGGREPAGGSAPKRPRECPRAGFPCSRRLSRRSLGEGGWYVAPGYWMRSLRGAGRLSSGRGWLVRRNAPCYGLTLFLTRFSATKKRPKL